MPDCICSRLRVGDTLLEQRNWNPDCPEHGVDSEWWNSPEQVAKRERRQRRTRDLQRAARQRWEAARDGAPVSVVDSSDRTHHVRQKVFRGRDWEPSPGSVLRRWRRLRRENERLREETVPYPPEVRDAIESVGDEPMVVASMDWQMLHEEVEDLRRRGRTEVEVEVERLRERVDDLLRLRWALEEIADQDWVELVLDPTWAQRVARSTLEQVRLEQPDDDEEM